MDLKQRNDASQRMKYLLSKLDSSQPSHVFRALVEIRTKYFGPKPNQMHLFVHHDGLQQLVVQIQKDCKKTVDVALSILGHCVLEPEPRILFRKAGGLPVLAQALRSATDTAVQTRACRALGSLAHDKRNSVKLMELSIHNSIFQLISQSENEEALCMALRAVKNLANSKEHIATMGRGCFIAKLWILMTKSENQNVLKNVLTTLSHICGYMQSFSERSAHYWVGSEDGGKYIARLVVLCHSSDQSISSRSFQLVQLMIQDRHVRPFLTGKEAFESLIPIVAEEKTNTRNWTIFMTLLLSLCRENPNMFRQSGGIPLLLNLIQRSDPEIATPDSADAFLRSHHSNLLNALLSFKNDSESLVKLAEGGVISILLTDVVRCVEASRQKRSSPELKGESKPHATVAAINSLIEDAIQTDIADQTDDIFCRHPDARSRFSSKRQYRTNSPSYQAVEMEYDQLFRFRQSTSSDALNLFGWNSNRSERTEPTSPQSSTSFSSPNHSSWSDYGSDGDASDGSPLNSSFPLAMSSNTSPGWSESSSPVGSPRSGSGDSYFLASSSGSSSELDELDTEDNGTICYSPANLDVAHFDSPRSSPLPPPGKRVKSGSDLETLCCESDLKMSWLHLGQIEGKDFYENWPEFYAENRLSHPVEWSIYLLYRLSWLPDPPRQLADVRFIKTIVDYLTETPRPTFYACRILFRLSSHPDLFVALLRSHFPLEVYSRLVRNVDMKHCCPLHSSLRRVGEQILEQICSIVAQFGRGEMENILLKSKDEATTLAVALAIPVIVKSRCLLRHFLIELDVLEVIWNALHREESVTYTTASLSALGHFLKMDDMLCPSIGLSDLFDAGPCRSSELSADVFFQISPQQSVGAVKDLLQVPFFQAMFHGGFTEANSTVIPLPNIEASVLEAILHVTYGCGRQCDVIARIDHLIQSDQLALGLLQSMDRFLLLQYSEKMCNLVGSQNWSACSNFPANYVALFQSLNGWNFPFGTKLKNHLLFFPFSNLADCSSRVEVIKFLLQAHSATAEQVVEDWKMIFLCRMDENSVL